MFCFVIGVTTLYYIIVQVVTFLLKRIVRKIYMYICNLFNSISYNKYKQLIMNYEKTKF